MKERQIKQITKTLNVEISANDKISSWSLFNGVFALPDHIREDLQNLWKETDSIQATIAVKTVEEHQLHIRRILD